MVSIQTNFVTTRLERWKARKHSHVNHGCVRTGYNNVWNMDKGDGISPPGTILPVRGQYSERPRTYRLWSIRRRSSSKLHRLGVDIHRMVPLAVGQRILGYGVGVVGHYLGEKTRRGVLQPIHYPNLLLCVGKDVKRGRSA